MAAGIDRQPDRYEREDIDRDKDKTSSRGEVVRCGATSKKVPIHWVGTTWQSGLIKAAYEPRWEAAASTIIERFGRAVRTRYLAIEGEGS